MIYRFPPCFSERAGCWAIPLSKNKRNKQMAWQESVASYDATFDRCRLRRRLSLPKTQHQLRRCWCETLNKEVKHANKCKDTWMLTLRQQDPNNGNWPGSIERWQSNQTSKIFGCDSDATGSICETWGHTMPYMQRSCCVAASKVHSIKGFVSDISSQILR